MSECVLSPSYPLRVVTGTVMASIDRIAIEERGIAGLFLMERAGEGVTEGLISSYPPEILHQTAILCGKGNNGGDGFVVARRLAERGFQPHVALIGKGEALKGDARTNFHFAQGLNIPITECENSSDLSAFFSQSPARLLVDALLGTGAKGAPRGLIAEAIDSVNQRARSCAIASVDIPSGVEADTARVEGDAVFADVVYTMGLPKVGHLLPPGLDYCRRLVTLDIGFPKDLIENADSTAELLTASQIGAWLPRRKLSAHKGTEGHLAILAGSRGMTGAALLCAKAALTMGAGLVTTACPESLLPIYAGGVWEMMTIPAPETPEGVLAEEAFESVFSNGARFSAVVTGPGMSRHAPAMNLVRKIVREVEAPVLIDGDGLFALTKEELTERKSPWVITPHPGEMARLCGVTSKEIQSDRWGYARRLTLNPNGVVVLKGPKTVVSCSGCPLFINPAGNPAMASGGMGDVLAGVIGALLARGLTPLHAACVGVYLHGLAADLLVERSGLETVLAGQVSSNLQQAIHHVREERCRDENVFKTG